MRLLTCPLTVVAFAVLLHTAQADDPLPQWIDAAIESNPGLAAARARWQAAGQRTAQARSFDDPMIGADFERSDSTRFDDYADIEYMASQRLPWFGRRGAQTESVRLEAEAEGFRYLEQIRQTRNDVTAAAWNLWLADRALEVNSESVALMKEFEAVARARYESGATHQADVLRAAIELQKMTNETASLQNERRVALNALNKALGAPADTPRSAEGLILPPPLKYPLEFYLRRARDFCCTLISFDRMASAKKAALRAARRGYSPDIEVRVEARQLDGKNSITEYDTGVFMNFPWVWRGKYRGAIREAKAALDQAEAELQDQINMTQLDAHEAFTMADQAYRNIQLLETSVLPSSRRLVEVMQAAYQTGGATFLERSDAQRALQAAQLEFHRAKADFAKAVAALNQITGPYGEPEKATGLVSDANDPVEPE